MENFYEKIEDYLLGELSVNEKTAFENALQSDVALAQSVAQHREMIQRLDALRLRNKVKSAIGPEGAKSQLGYSSRLILILIALFALLTAVFWFFNRQDEHAQDNQPATTPTETPATPSNETPSPKPEEPLPAKEKIKPAQLIAMAREFHERPSQSFVRDASQGNGDSSPKTPFQLAAAAFEQKNYGLVADLLKAEDQVKEDNARFLRASARFEIGQVAGAAQDFDALKNSFQFKHEARWNFLLCQIALGNTDQAKTLLDKMVTDKDFPFHAKALELKRKISF